METLRVEHNVESSTELIKDIHVYPDFHGNTMLYFLIRVLIDNFDFQGTGPQSLIQGCEGRLLVLYRWASLISHKTYLSTLFIIQDSSLTSLALSYTSTLHAIVLQTRHIINTMNSKGHHITSIFMSGGQTKNKVLMQLMADVCGMGIVVPKNEKAGGVDPVVLGATMLGRYADEASNNGGERGREGQAERLWSIMVRFASSIFVFLLFFILQVEMTSIGTLISPKASNKEKRLLEAKYKIFLETIDIQMRWRKEMDDAVTT